MNRYLTFLAAFLVSFASTAQNNDYLLKKDFQNEKKTISEGINTARKTSSELKKLLSKQAEITDSLVRVIATNEKLLARTNDSLLKTATRFNDLQANVEKRTSNSQNSLVLAVIIISVLLLFLLALIFYFKNKSDARIRELSEENLKLGEGFRQDLSHLKEQITKTASSMSLELHEHSANIATKLEMTEERQRQLAVELEDLVDKMVKDHNLQTSSLDARLSELKSAIIQKDEHRSVHEKLETEIKGLRSLHTKDMEEIRKTKH